MEERLEYECIEESIQLLKQGIDIGERKDWMHGFTEKTVANLPHNTGNVLYLVKEIILSFSFMEENKISLKWRKTLLDEVIVPLNDELR